MSGSVNKAILVGHVGQDPKVVTMNSGDKIVNLSIATSESWKDKNTGEKREKTEWHRVVIFNDNLGKFAANYAVKGAKVYVEGQIQTRKYNDNSGAEKYATEIVVPRFGGDFKILSDGGNSQRGGDAGERRGQQSSGGGRPSSDDQRGRQMPEDDDIPF